MQKQELYSNLYNNFNELPEPIDSLHPHEHDLHQAIKWLDASREYEQLGRHDSLPEDTTAQAFYNGNIRRGAEQIIDNSLRDLSTAVFRESIPGAMPLSDDERIVQNDSMTYFEAWTALKEQNNSDSPNLGAIKQLLEVKKSFNQASRHHGDNDNTTYKRLLNNALGPALHLQLELEASDDQMSFTATSLKITIARAIHDLAINQEFGNDSQAAQHMAIENLWDAAEEIKNVDPELLPDWAKQGYLSEIEYFRGLYSDEIGIDNTKRPSETERLRALSEAAKNTGKYAVDSYFIPPHAA